MLTAVFPKMVHSISLTHVGVEREMKINNALVVTHLLSKNYKQLLGYYNQYNATVDIKIIKGKKQQQDVGWSVQHGRLSWHTSNEQVT